MQEPRARMRTAEKVAGVIAVIAALVVLNGAWVNQHSFQNVSWRVAVAALLVLLMVIVETSAFGLLRAHDRSEEAAVPAFMRISGEAQSGEAQSGLEPEPESVSTGAPSARV